MSLTVDLHQHVIPDFYWEASNEDGNAAGGITPPRWSLDGAIARFDSFEHQISAADLQAHARRFAESEFVRKFTASIDRVMQCDRPLPHTHSESVLEEGL